MLSHFVSLVFPQCVTQSYLSALEDTISLSLSLFFPCSATSAGSGGGQMKRMYSAVPGRVYVATRAHSASGDKELSLSKGDKVKGEIQPNYTNGEI